MIEAAVLGIVKQVLGGSWAVYTSLRDSERMGLILLEEYNNYGASGGMGSGMGSDFNGNKTKEITTVEEAVKYCKMKIVARGHHKAGAAAWSVGVSATTAAIGGIGGSIVPVAGTAAGIAVGAGIGFALSTGVVYGARGIKKLGKFMTGSLGKHRKEAATVLQNAFFFSSTPEDIRAAAKALIVLQGKEEFERCVNGGAYGGGNDDEWLALIIESMSSWK